MWLMYDLVVERLKILYFIIIELKESDYVCYMVKIMIKILKILYKYVLFSYSVVWEWILVIYWCGI